MIFIRKHGNQIAEHMRRRRKAVQEQNGGSIPGTGFAIEDFQPLHVKRAIENGRRNSVRHLNSPSARELHLRMNADDRLSLDPLGRVEGGNRIVEGSHVADICPQPTIPDPLAELTQLGAIGYDDEVDSQAARGLRLGRAGNGYQRSSGANHARRPLRDVAAEDIENQIDTADIFQGVVIEVDELLCAVVESRLTAGSAPGADDVRAGLTCELGRHRTDYAGRTVHEDALPRTKAAVLEQPLPRGQARHHEGRTHGEVNVARQRCEVACLDGYILRQRAVPSNLFAINKSSLLMAS